MNGKHLALIQKENPADISRQHFPAGENRYRKVWMFMFDVIQDILKEV